MESGEYAYVDNPCNMMTTFMVAVNCGKHLQLVWSDEFNGNSVDNNKWEIADKWRDGRCEDKPQYQLHCDSNSLKNLQLRESCLAITAVRETPDTDNDRYRTDPSATDYTSASVVSTHDWTYDVFDLRAALPAGKLLRPVISLTERNGTGGQIDIVSNDQIKRCGNQRFGHRLIGRCGGMVLSDKQNTARLSQLYYRVERIGCPLVSR
ncbi:unnamed protein product [Medioppia subpectinata]|uniref:Uncharacterized protein n=1 Tax=Medioppia subpectinata TaxID=1979941 RepID=A0A7R9Q3Z3_9ACAR|nr:unnamed protein product [Medioppia subpectinata]CAG2111829.1 unnamed protein product [Medioppia subpectinata]